MDSASSSASSSPAFRTAVFKHQLLTPQQRYKQQQLQREQMMAERAAAAAERVGRDRMARGKDPYCSDDDSDEGQQLGSNSPAKFRLGGSADQEDFSKKERREKAIAYLSSPELLMMYAQSSNDSIAGARLHFMKMMCGYDDDSIDEASMSYSANTTSRNSRQARDPDRRRGGDRASGR